MARSGGGPSGLGAVTVVFVAVLGWWWFGGNGPMTPPGNADRLAVLAETPTPLPSTGTPSQRPLPGTVPVQGYALETASRLLLTFTTGAPECVGTLQTPEVVESDAAVIVRLRLDAEDRPPGPCREVMRVGTVPVELGVPLGDRSVLDGSLPRAQRVPPLG